MKELTTVVSFTKPGPGWVRVTPEILLQLEESNKRLDVIKKKLEQFQKEMLTELSKNNEII
jgi:hypothetical protein